MSNNITGYTGIRIKNGNKYVAEITVIRKKHYIGEYKLLSDAVLARNAYIINNDLQQRYKLQIIK
jgi:hypothetical protein